MGNEDGYQAAIEAKSAAIWKGEKTWEETMH